MKTMAVLLAVAVMASGCATGKPDVAVVPIEGGAAATMTFGAAAKKHVSSNWGKYLSGVIIGGAGFWYGDRQGYWGGKGNSDSSQSTRTSTSSRDQTAGRDAPRVEVNVHNDNPSYSPVTIDIKVVGGDNSEGTAP